MLSKTNKNIIANLFGGLITGLLVLLCTPFYVEYLGMESYALIGLFVSFVAVSTLLDLGMSPTIMREMARLNAGEHTPNSIHDLQRSFEILSLILVTLLVFFIWSQSDFIATNLITANKLSTEIVSNSLTLLAIGVALRFFEGLYRAGLYGLKHQVWFNVVHSILQIMRYVGVLFVFEYFTPKIELFFLWQISISIISIILYWVKLNISLPKKERIARFSPSALKKILGFAQGMFIITITSILWKQVDQFLLVYLLPLEDYGKYVLAMTLGSALVLAIAPVTQAYYPRLVELIANNEQRELSDSYRTMSQTITLLVSSASLLMCFYSEGIVYIWTGDKVISSDISLLVSIIAISSLIIAQLYSPYNFLIAKGKTKYPIYLNATSLVFIIPMIFILAPIYGAISVIIVKLVADIIRMLVYRIVIKKYFPNSSHLKWFLSDFLMPFFGALVVTFCSTFINSDPYNFPIKFFFLLVITFLASSVISLVLAKNLRVQFIEFSQKILIHYKSNN